MLRLAILFAAAILTGATPSGDAAATRALTLADRVQLSLLVPKRVYPENALVRVTVRLKNISGHVLSISRGCLYGPVWAEVVTRRRAVSYPPALADCAPLSCPAPVWMALHPGQIVQRNVYVILRTRQIRAVTELEVGGYYYGQVAYTRLLRGRAPRVSLGTSPELHADIYPTIPVRGPLHYIEWAKCPGAGGSGPLATYNATRTWQSVRSTRLFASFGTRCGKGFEWHVAAGWVNHPVVYVDYVQR
jgi:hypothetical protein